MCVHLESVYLFFVCTIYAKVLQYQINLLGCDACFGKYLGTLQGNLFKPQDKGSRFLGKFGTYLQICMV